MTSSGGLLALTAFGLVAGVTSPAFAGPRRILVLPLEGDADLAVRVQVKGSLERLADTLDGVVTIGDTTFAETAAAVGCDPQTPSCVDEVILTLGVDELVWGTATAHRGHTVVVVRRATPRTKPRETTANVQSGESPARTDEQLGPMFGVVAAPNGMPLPPGPSEVDTRSRNLSIAFTAGGGLMMLVGFILWANQSSTQSAINTHPTATLEDFEALEAIEDRSMTYAVVGDLMVFGGLALGGYGGYRLYQDRKRRLAVRPTTMANGAGVTFELVMP